MNEWISVYDSYPEPGIDVLVCNERAMAVAELTCWNNVFTWYSGDNVWDVTHWMWLPKFPTDGPTETSTPQ